MSQDPPAGQLVAEYAMALDLCSDLTRVLDEKEVLQRILDIFTALFAPQRMACWVCENGTVIAILTRPESPASLLQMPDSSDLPASFPEGFRLKIPYKDETIAILSIDGLAFPEYRDRYLSLAMSIAGVCGLAVSNARAHHRLETALSDLRREYTLTDQLSRDLKTANEELEQRVRERTAELEKTLAELREEVRHRKEAEETVRKRLEEKILLLRELDHRVKNNFQLISSILATHARKAKDPALRLALSESRNRIRTIVAAEEKLLSAKDFSRIDLESYIRSIISGLFSLYQIPPGRFTVTLDTRDVIIDINTAIPVGLILNELISNSMRHGYPAGQRGEISVLIRDEGSSLTIICRDDGTGLPPSFDWKNPDTTGMVLVHSLIDQVEGSIEREPGAGTRFIIHIRKMVAESGAVRGTYNQIPE